MLERDEQGRPSKWVTETEPEFDANERDDWHALWEYEQALCHQCGNLRSVCSDPEQAWYAQRSTCWATTAREVNMRKWAAMVERARTDEHGYKWALDKKRRTIPVDGTVVWVASEDLSPDDDFLV